MKPTPNNFTTFCSENSHIDDNKKKNNSKRKKTKPFLILFEVTTEILFSQPKELFDINFLW